VEVARGEIWWADLPDPEDSSPAGTRPVLVIQSQSFNRSRLQTVVIAVVTSNLALAHAPGNVEVGSRESGLPQISVINVSQLFTLDKHSLRERSGRLRPGTLERVDQGLRLALAL
jgi:mRNA interferase MazF